MNPDGLLTNYLFWMITGAFLVLIWQGIGLWMREFGARLPWWRHFLLFGCFVSFCMVIFAGFTLKGEGEGSSGWYFIGLFGVLHIIAAVILVRLFLPGKNVRTATAGR